MKPDCNRLSVGQSGTGHIRWEGAADMVRRGLAGAVGARIRRQTLMEQGWEAKDEAKDGKRKKL